MKWNRFHNINREVFLERIRRDRKPQINVNVDNIPLIHEFKLHDNLRFGHSVETHDQMYRLLNLVPINDMPLMFRLVGGGTVPLSIGYASVDQLKHFITLAISDEDDQKQLDRSE